MKNTINETTKLFIEKLQKIGKELYEEYNSLDIDDEIKYCCPLTDTIDNLYGISCMTVDEVIEEY